MQLVLISNSAESKGGIWNLWFNLTLTDDPEHWDNEIRIINKMQKNFGELDREHRLIRAHMTEFCRLHPSFPQSIAILCEEIGTGRFSKPVKTGCEGRGLLESLGYPDDESLNEHRAEVLREYSLGFQKWLENDKPETSTEFKIRGFLGTPTADDKAFIKRPASLTEPEAFSISSLKELCKGKCTKVHGSTIFKTRARPLNCFSCGGCECDYTKFLNAALLCTASHNALVISDEFLRYVEEYILAYSLAINSWLEGTKPHLVIELAQTRYIDDSNAQKIAEKVHASLGEKDEVKEWLAACLLKTIKDNQRWHERKELIDDFPEAVSYFKTLDCYALI